MNSDNVPASYEPGDAAHQLGVSPSGLRRLAAAYEEVHGDLPRKVGTKARLYPETVLEQIAQARSLVEAGRYGSNAEALEALKRGLEPSESAELKLQTDQAAPQALTQFIEEQRGTLSRIEAALARLESHEHPQNVLQNATMPEREHGLLVRVALWFEGLLQGSR